MFGFGELVLWLRVDKPHRKSCGFENMLWTGSKTITIDVYVSNAVYLFSMLRPENHRDLGSLTLGLNNNHSYFLLNNANSYMYAV